MPTPRLDVRVRRSFLFALQRLQTSSLVGRVESVVIASNVSATANYFCHKRDFVALQTLRVALTVYHLMMHIHAGQEFFLARICDMIL